MQNRQARWVNMTKAVLTVLILAIFTSAYSQKNYIPAKVITLRGDTLYGQIDYRNPDKNPEKIEFAPLSGSPPLTFTPSDIAGFMVDDEVYVSAPVTIEVSPSGSNLMDENPEFRLRADTVFLRAVVAGNKGLYILKNSEGNINFFIKIDTGYEYLRYKKYKAIVSDQNVILENKEYIGQLRSYMGDCEMIWALLRDVSYTHYSLSRLFRSYFGCMNYEIMHHKSADKPVIELGLVSGTSFSKINFSTNGFSHLDNTVYSRSVNYSGGLFLDFVFPANMGKISVNNELIFTKYHSSGEYDWEVNSVFTEFEYSYIRLNNMLRFKYPVGTMYLMANVGISNGIEISGSNYLKPRIEYVTGEPFKEGEAIEDTKKYEQGILAGLGARYRSFSLEFRYELGNGISWNQAIASKTQRIYILAGFRFNRRGS